MEEFAYTAVYVIMILIMIAFALFFYMIPTVLAFARGHPHRVALLFINVILGGTGIVWIGVLIWALAIPVKEEDTAASRRFPGGASPFERPRTHNRPAPDPFAKQSHPLV